MRIGLTGTNASGKTTVVNYLLLKGFEYHSLSDVIRQELDMRGMETSRENLRVVGNELRDHCGPSILADRIIAKLGDNNAVIDSIRNVCEVAALRTLEKFTLIAIDAPVEQRYKRAKERGRLESAVDLNSFIEAENKEMSESVIAQNIHKCIALADYHLINDGDIEELFRQIDHILRELED